MARSGFVDYFVLTGYLPLTERWRHTTHNRQRLRYASGTGMYLNKEEIIQEMIRQGGLGYTTRAKMEAATFSGKDAETIQKEIQGLTITETGEIIITEPSILEDIELHNPDFKSVGIAPLQVGYYKEDKEDKDVVTTGISKTKEGGYAIILLVGICIIGLLYFILGKRSG